MRHMVENPEREAGLATTSLLFMLPVVTVILTGLLTISLWGLQHYLKIFADIELEQEVQMAVERLTDDMSQARSLMLYRDRERLTIQVVSRNSENGIYRCSYGYHTTQDRLHKITYGSDGHPLTAGHALAEVDIVQYVCRERKPGLYELTVRGRSQRTGHYYTLSTLVFLPPVQAGGDGDAG